MDKIKEQKQLILHAAYLSLIGAEKDIRTASGVYMTLIEDENKAQSMQESANHACEHICDMIGRINREIAKLGS